MKLLYGTTNPAKLESMRRLTAPLGLEIVGLKELGSPIPDVDESGRDPLENARIKAETYYRAFGIPVFSCDSGLYFDGLCDEEQPGVWIRRVGGRELSDEEMIAYYAALASKHGGRLIGRYRNAVWLILDEKHAAGNMDKSLWTEPFILVDRPHEKRVKGYPLDALSVDIATEKYYYDIKEKSVDKSAIEEGYQAFFRTALSL